jgi:pimeloyl-ACP methyl ester carboxylesterase
MIIKSDYRIASVTDGYGLVLRNKHLNDAEHRLPGNSVLFIHGATYGSTSTFDYDIEGESWMDKMAREGFDVWCLDLLGYGESDRPEEMLVAPDRNDPIVDTAHAVAEVDRAVDFILKDRGIQQLSLIGYSWGSAICGRYAGQFAGKVMRLVLSGALWVEKGATPKTINADIGAYRTVDAASMAKRWAIGLSQDEIDAVVPPARVSRWCSDTVLVDPGGDKSGLLRAPTGVLKDFRHYSETGDPWYEPTAILAPTQIVVGELDRETTPEQGRKIFEQLGNAREKRMTVIGQGTHSLLLEDHRDALHSVVSGFLA